MVSTKTPSTLVFCIAITASFFVSIPDVAGGVLAVSGFNDATGVQSDRFPGSPFVAGVTVHNQGLGETGWDGPWQRLGCAKLGSLGLVILVVFVPLSRLLIWFRQVQELSQFRRDRR